MMSPAVAEHSQGLGKEHTDTLSRIPASFQCPGVHRSIGPHGPIYLLTQISTAGDAKNEGRAVKCEDRIYSPWTGPTQLEGASATFISRNQLGFGDSYATIV
jgi:hypothetical protein